MTEAPTTGRLLERIARQGREAAFSAQQSRELFESFYPSRSQRETILGRLADSIETAHRLSSRGWVITRDWNGKFVRLSAGRLVVVDLWPDTVYLLLTVDDDAEAVELPFELSGSIPTSVPGVRWHAFSVGNIPERWPAIIESRHQEAIARCLASAKRTPYARWHAPGVLDYLRSALGRALPDPGYPTDPVARLLEEIVHTLNKEYPDWAGFSDSRFVRDEVAYKRKASALARERLGKERLGELIATRQYDEVVRGVDAIAHATNLLYLSTPNSGDLALLNRDDLSREDLSRAIFELLYGDGTSPERLGRFSAWVSARSLPNKWSFPTYLLFLCSPDTDFFVKPRVVTAFAKAVGLQAKFEGAPDAKLYETLLTLAQELKEAMARYGPTDLIDIQSVAWIVGRKGDSADVDDGEGPGIAPVVTTDTKTTGSEIREGSKARIEPNPLALLSPRAFELLLSLAKAPTKGTYLDAKDDFQAEIEQPIQWLLREVAAALPPPMREVLETEENLFGRFLKNDYGKGGAWPFYWGALYAKGSKRLLDGQLFVWVHHDRLEAGFAVGEYAGEAAKRLVENLRTHRSTLLPLLAPRIVPAELTFGVRAEDWGTQRGGIKPSVSFEDWVADPWKVGPQARRTWLPAEIMSTPREALVAAVVDLFERLFPLVLLSRATNDPVADVARVIHPADQEPEPDLNPELPLPAIAATTGIGQEDLERWVRAIRRKRQAVLYGPPGTGKTFVADHLARHLVGGGAGIVELVQFHPAYAYEDFIQGIRPRTIDGAVTYELEPGRFVDFCRRAERLNGNSVLIIDEINRANLSRVFGELMYLLEYRERELPLAGGRSLRIPENVFVIGTMNTADRSIALVDHALRRRFAFLRLAPQYDVLTRYHQKNCTGFDPSGLIELLRKVNHTINDPHYEIGISFFLRKGLQQEIEDIWRMEIVPYLEEFFFDQPAKAAGFAWEKVRDQVVDG